MSLAPKDKPAPGSWLLPASTRNAYDSYFNNDFPQQVDYRYETGTALWQLTSLAGFCNKYLLDAGNPCGQQLALTLLRDYRHATAPIAAIAIATDISEGAGAERGYLEEGPEARAQANASYDLNRLSCGGESFTPATRVLLPGGKTVAIASLKPGDKVLAADTKTGKDQPETTSTWAIGHAGHLTRYVPCCRVIAIIAADSPSAGPAPARLFLHVDLTPLDLAGRVSRCEARDYRLNLCLNRIRAQETVSHPHSASGNIAFLQGPGLVGICGGADSCVTASCRWLAAVIPPCAHRLLRWSHDSHAPSG
jgi:hypothetical protein